LNRILTGLIRASQPIARRKSLRKEMLPLKLT